jgi:hypothetical protein
MPSTFESNEVFDDTPALQRASVQLELDPTTLPRLLGLLAQRGSGPRRLHYRVCGNSAELLIEAELGHHSWQVLAQRAATLVGVLAWDDTAC